MKIENAIGKWCLIRLGRWERIVKEVKIIDVSPSGDYVKYRFSDSRPQWKHIRDLKLIEILNYG